ncbi:class I lanthipeptide [Porphyromonas sp.]|uniref:class I lanthipeptide n=1 Tax=Porphyromonas sp. TaxID=1924944 RepID=UPI0026DB6E26|nr:class I lanthipeptide [Porphyromonas sp.]MDO4771527.1 class I lanthipeptide [Porphyromonas sp.]
MEQKKLSLEKEVVSRLQDEEMSHIVGAESHSNTTSSKELTEELDTKGEEDQRRSCCQKSCRKD